MLGFRPIGDPVQRLCDAIEECKCMWANDAGYRSVCFKLDQAQQELELLEASPGRLAVLRSAMPVMSGQEPENRTEPY